MAVTNEHISLAVYDHYRQKVCDLYDSDVKVDGQAYQIQYTSELNGWQEVSFKLPFLSNRTTNFRWGYIRNEYLLRLRKGELTEWFFLQTPNMVKNGRAVSNTVKCAHISSI